MSVLIDRDTKVLCQGFTGSRGTHFSNQMMEYGTNIVAGVTPGKGGRTHLKRPVFDKVADAIAETGANASMIFVPADQAAAAAIEAIDAEIALVVCVTEGMAIKDMMHIRQVLKTSNTRFVGPNCPGVITPGQCKLGIMPGSIHHPGPVGVVSRSGTLYYEAVIQLGQEKIGQSTCIGIGADPIGGLSFVDAIKLFAEDAQTEAILMIGEIGGRAEEEVADYLASSPLDKPLVAYVAGRVAPPERRMGHAGAIINGSIGRSVDKLTALRGAGVQIADSPARIGVTVAQQLA